MKRILSVFMAVVMLFGTFAVTASSASDTCIRLSDTSGSTGYSAGSDAVNEYVVENDGATLIFDVMLESVASVPSGMTSRIAAFTGGDVYNYAGYSFTDGAFVAGCGNGWPTVKHADAFDCYSSNSFDWEKGKWYELAFQFDGNVATVYLDGIPMVSAEVDDSAFTTQYLILYPQYCTILIDNLRVCSKDYNVRDRYGDVYATEDFSGVTSVSGVSDWSFSDGYSVAANGRPMPELSEMLPDREVSPAISGAYLKYAEAGGSGLAATGVYFNTYNGFTIVEDIRVDRKSVLGNFGVRFGNNFIAGYDFDTSSFMIAQRSGYGFNTGSSYVYAKTEYALNLKETYEFAVRQNGNIVSVYLNGVLMAQAVNDSFATGYNSVEINSYRIGASVDNLVIAYPDYDVREAKGSAAAKFTFDESADYINGFWNFALGTGKTGYSIAAEAPAASVVVDSVSAVDGVASVGIDLANCPGFTAFELQVSYPAGLTVSSATVSSSLDGANSLSKVSQNPLVLAYAATAENPITDSEVLTVNFNTPETAGNYTVTATLIPYIGDITCAEITGTGTITVPEPGLSVGLPDGLAYDGETITWNAPDNAIAYEIYLLYEGDDYEYYIDFTEESEYSFPYMDFIPDPGVYYLRIYMYDDSYELASVSEDFAVYVDEDGNIYGGYDAYADELYGRLEAYVAANTYSDDNQAMIDGYLADAQFDIYASEDFFSMYEIYEEYKLLIEEIPTGSDVLLGDVNGDSLINNNDYSYLIRYLKGAGVAVTEGADINMSGAIDNTDLSKLILLLQTAG